MNVSQVLAPHDPMYVAEFPRGYFHIGQASFKAVRVGLQRVGIEPQRALDLPCGYGRGLRWLVAELDAEFVACDLNPDAVDFCAREFDVTPLYSHPEPEQIPLEGKFDLITCGSLFTHLPAPMWRRFLTVFRDHLDGMLAFSTGGRTFGPDIRSFLAKPLGEQTADELLASYEQTGFGFADCPGYENYGLARAKPSWVLSLLDELGLRVFHMGEGGWDGHQDIYCVCRADAT